MECGERCPDCLLGKTSMRARVDWKHAIGGDLKDGTCRNVRILSYRVVCVVAKRYAVNSKIRERPPNYG